MPYELHPSPLLQDSFEQQPWQGANPMHAKYIFVGLDANFAPNIVEQIPEILSYLANGPQFWTDSGVHHPFMLDQYSGCGGLYHNNFRLIEFIPAEANQVSFVELIEKPTTGRSNLDINDLSDNHLARLLNFFNNGTAKYILMPPTVVALMKKKPLFSWLRRTPVRIDGDLAVLRDKTDPRQIIYRMYHLSNYGQYDAMLKRQIDQLKAIVRAERNGG